MVLQQQVAIVTGGGRGLGRAIALEFAALGAHVVVASRNAPQLDEVVRTIKKAGGRALAQTADIADERQVQDLVLATEQWVGPATIVVNNAGVVDPLGPLARSSSALWLRNISINVGGTYLVTRAALPGMLDRDYGRIINIVSGAAIRPSAGWTAYSTAKAAIVHLTRVLALELTGTGVTVAAFAPGIMDTDMQTHVRSVPVEQLAISDKLRAIKESGGLIDPADSAKIVAYLATSGAARNGAVLEMGDAELAQAARAVLGGS